MTSEEIKKNVSMPDVMSRYGISVRNNMCKCPFHGRDDHPSMKVFKDGANCFTCGWNGDVFSFVMDMEHVDFKTAYKALGGSYNRAKSVSGRSINTARIMAKKSEIERKTQAEHEFKKELSEGINICRVASRTLEPYSEDWCYAINSLFYLLRNWESKYIAEEEIEELHVHRELRKIRHYFL